MTLHSSGPVRPMVSAPARSLTPARPNATQAPIRVTLIDGDELTVRGVASMLREHPGQIQLVSSSGPRTQPIDIALYDPAGGRADGPALVQILADTSIRKVVVFTSHFQPWTAAGFIEQGACAYLSKGLASGELVEALRAVHSGRAVVESGKRASGVPQRDAANHGETLTEREAQVLSLISRGLSNTEIASTLNLSANTVKSYIRTCYRKIAVESRSKAVLWALSNGYGDSGSPVARTERQHELAQRSFAS